MRRNTFGILSVGVTLVIGLTGCGTAGQAAGDGASLSESYPDALPVVAQLVVGTLKLEESDLAITADQAQELVPLWQAYRTLMTSQTSAQQERDALLTQIEQTMTAEQLKGIAEMKLAAADMQTVFRNRSPQEQGQASGTQAPGQRQFFGQAGGGGGFPGGGGGGFPGGGGFTGGGGGGFNGGGEGFFGGLAPGQTPNPQAIETLRAERGGASGLTSSLNPGLVGVLIQFLQQKSGATPVATPTAG